MVRNGGDILKKRILYRDIKRCMRKSMGRFFSIMCLVALGSFALVGLFVSGPDMRATSKDYFADLALADISIIGDWGIDESNAEKINSASGIHSVEYGYLKDVVIENENTGIRIFSKPENISKYELVSGRMPENENEVALASFYSEKYKLNDTFSFSEKADASGKNVLKNNSLTVVGFVNSSELLSIINMGQSTAGTGELGGYAVCTQSAFDSDVYMIARITFNDTLGIDPYTKEYTKLIQAHKDELEELLAGEADERLNAIKTEYGNELDDAKEQLAQAKQELEDAKKKLDDGKKDLDKAKSEYNSGLKKYNDEKTEITKKFDDAKQQLDSAKAQIESAEAQISENEKVLAENKKELQAARAELDAAWQQYNQALESIIESGGDASMLEEKKAQLENKEAEYNTNKAHIEAAQSMLENSKNELGGKKAEYSQQVNEYNLQKSSAEDQLKTAKQKLDSALKEIQSGTDELTKGQKEYDEKAPDAQKKIDDAQNDINQAQRKLDALSVSSFNIDTRREIPGSEGYRVYSTIASIVDALARVFPIFLYFVAALVTLTTMTRFVDEERINSGTLKALGYTSEDIVKKFTYYGLAASMTGAAIGVAAGHTLLPFIVYNAYGKSFTYPKIQFKFYPVITISAFILALLCAVVPAYIVAKNDLKEKPAALLQPKPPKAGSKIFLERIKPLWNNLSFTHKVTARNIFRYKKRMFMTIFGVCGSVTMLFAGFSVQHSIAGINDKQFGEIMKYDLIVAQKSGITDYEKSELEELLNSSGVKNEISVYYETVTKNAGNNNDKQSIKLIVSNVPQELEGYIQLRNRKTGIKAELSSSGCVISERLSTLLKVKEGDSFEVTDSFGKKHTAVVSGICEMYTGHFMFMSSDYYENSFSQDYMPNAYLVTLNDRSADNAKEQASLFMALDGVKGVVQNTTMTNQIDTIVEALNKIMDILILVAALLAAVILYNLTNINVSERIRELSTIKVLGFYNKEVTMYIYRETILLTILGILTGFVFGDMLYRYIIYVVPPEDVMFDPVLGFKAFVIPTVIISAITCILGIMVNRRLKNVDMLGALKSVE